MLLGLLGRRGAGKDMVADHLVARHGFTKIAFADPLKRTAGAWFGWSDERLWGSSKHREEIDTAYGFSARYALQVMGTEIGRRLSRDLWTNIALRDARVIFDHPLSATYHPRHGVVRDAPLQRRTFGGVVISDVRFRSEVEKIQAAGGRVIRLKRGMVDRTWWQRLLGLPREHASESEQLSIPDTTLDYVIDNRHWTVAQTKGAIDRFLALSPSLSPVHR